MRTDEVPVASSSSTAWWREKPMAPLRRSVAEWRSIVIDAYATLPTLSVTRPQGQRLWGMDCATCGHVLDGLVDAGLLVRTTGGQYCRADYIPSDDTIAVL